MIRWLRLLITVVVLPLILTTVQLKSNESSSFIDFSESEREEPVKIELIQEEQSIQAGRPFWVIVKLKLENGWHTYWKNSGDGAPPCFLTWDLPDNFTAAPADWPQPQRFDHGGITAYGYENEIYLLTQITPPKNFLNHEPVTISGQVRWVVCSDSTCQPGENEFSLTLPISTEEPIANNEATAHFIKARSQPFQKEWNVQDEIAMADPISHPPVTVQPMPSQEFEGGVGLAIVFAFIGGMILNLMPCVLPVISFKVLSFVKMAGQDRSLTFKHGLIFSLGVLVSFWTLAGIMLALQAYGHAVGWGFQLQEPIFVAGLAAVLLLFALSLFGVFEIGTSITSLAGQVQNPAASEGVLNSFLSGVLATAVATPCTGPFLGSAIGFAVTLPAHLSLLIFTSLGLGMAFPYLLLSAFPSLLRFMPKPGKWMVAFKEIMGFLMIATVLWLIWVFGAQTNTFAIFLLLVGFFMLAIGSWIYGKWGTPYQSKRCRVIAYTFALLCGLAAGQAIVTSTSLKVLALEDSRSKESNLTADAWEDFSPKRVEALRQQGVPVLIDFTAKWCLICQANHLVLSSSDVENRLKELGAVKMKADWTKNDQVITKELRKFGRSGVPLYVLYGNNPTEAPQILPQVLTSDIVLQHLDKLETNIASSK